MASNIKFKRSAVQNRVPTTAQLDLGELALNTYDGKLYTEINTGSAAVVEIGSKLSSLVVDGANGAGGGDVVFHGTTSGYDLTWDYSDNALEFVDNVKAKFGSSNDLQIYHNGTDSIIDFTENVHNLRIRGDGEIRLEARYNELSLKAIKNGAVELYHDNSVRITTTADGADISGTGSLKVPVGTTAQRNSSPAAGDIRYNSTLGSFEGYSSSWGELGGGGVGIGSTSTNPSSGVVGNRIGVGFTDINIVGTGVSVTGYGTTIVIDFNDFKPGSFHRTIHNYTATAGQTTFGGLNYETSEKQIAVYLNGARLSEATYTATSGTTVVLDVGASVGDEVEIINIHTNSDVDRKVNTYTATAGQTTFTGLSYNSKTELDVYLNGIRLASDDFTATSGTTVVLAVGASVNDIVDIVSTGDGVSFRSTADASGDRFTFSNVGIGTDITPDKLNVTGNVNIVGVLTATTLHGDGINLTNTGSSLSEPSSGTHRLVTTSLTSGTMTSSGTDSTLSFNYGTHTLSATNFSGNGASLTNLNASNLASGTVPTARLGSGTASSSTFLRGDSTFAVVDTDLVADTSPQLGGDLDTNSFEILLDDDHKVKFGNSGIFEMHYDSSANYGIIRSTGAGSIIQSAIFKVKNAAGNADMIVANTTGSVELYHNNSKKLETTADGIFVTNITNNQGIELLGAGNNTCIRFRSTGSSPSHTYRINLHTSSGGIFNSPCLSFDKTLTNGNFSGHIAAISDDGFHLDDNKKLHLGGKNVGAGDLQIFHNGSNSYIDNLTGAFYIRPANNFFVQNRDTGEVYLKGIENGAVELYHNGSKKLETTSGGAKVTGDLVVTGDLTSEDVTTISSVGIITAQNGIQVTGGNITMSTAGNIVLGDSGGATDDRIVLGAGTDLSIFHNGNHSKILNVTGELRLDGNSIKLKNEDEDENYITCTDTAGVELFYANSKKLETTSYGTLVTGRLTTTGNITAPDSAQIQLGDGIDLAIYHDGSNSIIDTNTGDLILRSDADDVKILAEDGIVLRDNDDSTNFINCINGGAVELYHNGTKKFETTSDGATFSGSALFPDNQRVKLGGNASSPDTQLWHDGSNTYIHHSGTGDLIARIAKDNGIFRVYGNGNTSVANFKDNAEVELFYNGSHRFETTSDGVSVTGELTAKTAKFTDDGGASPIVCIKTDDQSPWAFSMGNDSYNTAEHAGLQFYQANSGDCTWHVRGIGSYLNMTWQSSNNSTSQTYMKVDTNRAIGLYYQGSQKLITTNSGVSISGSVIATGNMQVNDNNYLYLGNSGDLNLRFLNGTGAFIQSGGNSMFIRSNLIELGDNSGHKYIKCIDAGAVELYHGVNSKKLETTSYGTLITGECRASGSFQLLDYDGSTSGYMKFGNGDDLRIYHDGTNSTIRNTNDSGRLDIRSDTVHISDNDNTHDMARFNYQGSVQLYHNYSEKFATTSYGVLISGNVQSNTIYPSANNSYDLGTTSTRWRNIYTNDLNLSNEGSSNDVDGTWGSYTIQEGEDDLFLINKRSGKKYKFNLTEVS